MKISDIAYQINLNLKGCEIEKFQYIRKALKNNKRIPSKDLFDKRTIKDDEKWAFNIGGRKEIQFNIGFENNDLRYGVAFSFQVSRSLLDISIFDKSIFLFNQFVINNPYYFDDFKMWHCNEKGRSKNYNVKKIDDKLYKEGTFIFIGKLIAKDSIDYSKIIETFDYLLTLYKYVENRTEYAIEDVIVYGNKVESYYEFISGHNFPSSFSSKNINENLIEINSRHVLIQNKLYNKLVNEYGNENVGTENQIFGKRIDLVVKIENEYVFYEIKTAQSAKECVREAIGQLLEYCFYKSKTNDGYASKLVIVGESTLDENTKKYLELLSKKIKKAVSYLSIKI